MEKYNSQSSIDAIRECVRALSVYMTIHISKQDKESCICCGSTEDVYAILRPTNDKYLCKNCLYDCFPYAKIILED